jgi:cyclopropane fatty-acyl-phospholipid synthase-like methyltransferase
MRAMPDAPAARSNRDAILGVIRQEFGGNDQVLEIGSGTGQHAVYFAAAMSGLSWQTSDREENHAGIIAWIGDAGLDNVRMPVALDVRHDTPPDGPFDAVYSANTAHIMSLDAVECMFRVAAGTLRHGGKFCLYGPFNIDGEFTSESNRRFDAALRKQDPVMGIRDLGQLDHVATGLGLRPLRRYAMPANNMIAVWER